jgi:hypothetical protein
MSNSIFHVRPLDSGKGWAIDEYDGRGAWQHSVPIGPDGAPMDKIQAQRAVFQLRRKAVNSAPKASPVNKYGEPETDLAEPNWERLKIDVRERIDALAATMSNRCNAPPELKAKLWSDLIRPNVKLLAEFCSNVTFDDDDREPLTDNTGCDS